MRTLPLLTFLLAALATTLAAPTFAQAPAAAEAKVFHAGGGRHDELAHNAALRARQEGRRMAEPKVHPGGRHDEAAHKAALRAQRAADEAARK